MRRPLADFTIDGPPVPKGRPRFARGRTYTPAKTAAAEERIRNLVALEFHQDPTTKPINIILAFGMQIPTSWTKAKKEDALQGWVPHISTPDLDNLVKLVTDALNGVIYKDDSQIVRLDAAKLYLPLPVTIITVFPYD